MTTFADKQKAMARAPIQMVRLTMDACSRTFGVAPCTGTGEPCYNTYPTCKSRPNFAKQAKDYEYVSAGTRPDFTGARPYIRNPGGVKLLPTEITDTLAVKGRVTVQMIDEPETSDIGLDPYPAQRTSAPKGTYWKKWLARNAAWQGRPAVVLEGYEGLPRSEYRQRWKGKIDTIDLGRGTVSFRLVDPLAVLDDIEIPQEVEVELVGAITDASTAATLTGDTARLPDAGHLRIDDEIVSYTAIDRQTNVVSGMTRALFGTEPDPDGYDEWTSVKLVHHIAPINPFDLLLQLLTNDPDPATAYPQTPGGKLPAESIDAAAFAYWRDNPGGEPLISGLIEEPTALQDLIREVLDLVDAAIWYNEAQQVTIRRNMPNDPAHGFVVLTDQANIVDNSGSAELNDESRYTRVTLYWERRGIENREKTPSYRRIDQARDVEAESPNEYGEIREKKILCRLLTTAADTIENLRDYAAGVTFRHLLRTRDANPLITIEVERKDGDIKTGDQIAITTDELLQPDGSPIVNARGIVRKRDENGSKVKLECEVFTGPKYLVIAPDEFPDEYGEGSAAQREYGCLTDDDGQVEGGPGYALF